MKTISEDAARVAAMPSPGILDSALQADLRSDHAGETGAVWIYHGILAISRDPDIRAFAEEHLETERGHLAFFDAWLPPRLHSRLLPLWRCAGWVLGALAALGGRRGVFLTIEAVETFVVEHYQQQIEYLAARCQHPEVQAVLRRFQQDEDEHRRDASDRSEPDLSPGLPGKVWTGLVSGGSRLAVSAARRL